MYIGAHVSMAGGIFNAPLNAAKIGAEVFQIFTRSPHGGPVSELTDDVIQLFKKNCELVGIQDWYVHAPYYINFASSNNRVRYGSISAIRQELERASLLGAKFLMTHLGSYSDLGKKEGFSQLIEGLNKVLEDYHNSAGFLIEISAGAGDVIGDTFEEIAEIIYHQKLKNYPIGVCLDTQHAFASGYDLRSEATVEQTLKAFDSVIGLEKLKVFHCNDSKIDFGGKQDRHEHIGEGKIGKNGFAALIKNKNIQHLNLILETEHDRVVNDINLLKKLRAK